MDATAAPDLPLLLVPLIYGGESVTPGEFPHQLQIQRQTMDHYCAGTILSTYLLLTAAHCFYDKGTTGQRLNETLYAVAGKHSRTRDDGWDQRTEIQTILIHPEYNSETLDNDIAIGVLKQELIFNSHVSSIPLPNSQVQPYLLETAMVSGWGLINSTTLASELQKGSVRFLTKDDCTTEFDKDTGVLCASFYGTGRWMDACGGDSGGPVNCYHGHNLDKSYVCGLVSAAITGTGEEDIKCGTKHETNAALYTDVYYFRGWILEVTEEIRRLHGCPSGYFRCRNNLCIRESFTCDLYDDCGDGSDEVCAHMFGASVSVDPKCPPIQLNCRLSALNYALRPYIYNFESEINIHADVVGAGRKESRQTRIKANVELLPSSSCDFILNVKKLSASDASGAFLVRVPNVKETSARFTLQDGVVSQVCLAENEPRFISNIQRAVISMFQNSALHAPDNQEEQVVEFDIFGKCPTNYTRSGDKFVKTKRLETCSRGNGGSFILNGVPYDIEPASTAGRPAASRCEQTIENGIIKSVSCTEEDVRDLTETRVETRLSLLKIGRLATKRIVPPSNLIQASLLFDHSDESSDSTRKGHAGQETREILRAICTRLSIENGAVSSEVALLVSNLRTTLAHVPKSPLKQLYNDIKSRSLCPAGTPEVKQLFLDAAAMSATDAAIGLLSELYREEEGLETSTKNYFHHYTMHAHRPGPEALESISPLLDHMREGLNYSPKLLLAVSGLAHQFCKIRSGYGEVGEYILVVDKLSQLVQAYLADGHLDDELIVALQALGNLDALTEQAAAAVSVALDSETERIRVQALDAFRRDPCVYELKTKARDILGNFSISGNVRTHAYLATLRCLCPEDVFVIQSVLDDEESFQVAGFIHSNLKNLLESTSPSTRHLQRTVRLLALQLDYPQDLLRFSRHVSFSSFDPDLNFGCFAEGAVIFSESSFIPQYLSANLSLDLHGLSYNIFEVGAYLQNVDAVEEFMLGPSGNSTGHTRSSWINATFPLVTVDLHIRRYGTTVAVVSYKTSNIEQAAKDVKEQVAKLLSSGLSHVFGERENMTMPLPLLDRDLSVPTSSGLGLTTFVQASIIISSLSHLEELPPLGIRSQKRHLKIAPKALVSLKLRHSIRGGPIENGIQFEGNLAGDGVAEVRLSRNKAAEWEAKLTFSGENAIGANITLTGVWMERDPGRPELKNYFPDSVSQTTRPFEGSCPASINSVLKSLGLQLCYKDVRVVRFEDVDAGVSSATASTHVSLEKTVASASQGYSLLVSSTGVNNKTLLISIPGSATITTFRGSLIYAPGGSVAFDLAAHQLPLPWSEVFLRGRLVGRHQYNSKLEYSHYLSVELQDGEAGFRRETEREPTRSVIAGTAKFQWKGTPRNDFKLTIQGNTTRGSCELVQTREWMDERALGYSSTYKYQTNVTFPHLNLLDEEVWVVVYVRVRQRMGRKGVAITFEDTSAFNQLSLINVNITKLLLAEYVPKALLELYWE